jgi:glucose/mannose transport system substrate-binding protein
MATIARGNGFTGQAWRVNMSRQARAGHRRAPPHHIRTMANLTFRSTPRYRAGWRAAAALMTACLAAAAHGGDIEVLHYWEVGNDAKAAAQLKAAVQRQGHTWKDFAVADGGNGLATSLLRSRVLSGNPPSAAQIKAPVSWQWAQLGALANLDDVARNEHWDEVLPKPVSDALKFKGSYASVPVNIHRLNWLWVNLRILNQAGARIPATWDEFFMTAEAMKRAGYTAVAHGGQPWQDFLLFETVALGVGGPDFQRRAFVALDPEALESPVMERVLQTFRRIKAYTAPAPSARGWMSTAKKLANDEAGMQLMGDWAKPVFLAAQDSSGLEFACVPAPDTAKAFSYVVDSFALFKVNSAAKARAQRDFASTLLSPSVQEEFNLDKGSIPVRLGVSLARFDRCAKLSSAAFQAAVRTNTLVPGISMSVPPAIEDAMREAVSAYWRDERITPQATMARLAAAARQRQNSPLPPA